MSTTVASYKVYTRRWFVLSLVTLLGLSNTEIWCSYASVANIAAEYYKVSTNEINLLSMVYFLCCFPFGVFALWFTDYVGLKKGVWIGAWLNAIGATIRVIGSMEFVAESQRFKVTLVGQIVAGLAQMYLYVPTKVAETWFPSNERTLATSLMAMSNPCGIMLGTGLVPVFVTKPQSIPWLNMISCAFAIVCVISTCGFTSSKPPAPPSGSADVRSKPSFLVALKEMVRSKPYLLLLMFGGAIIGSTGVFFTTLEEVLYPIGYTNKFSGSCLVVMLTFGIVGGAFCGILVDRTKSFIPIAKITGGLSCIVFPIYVVVLGIPGMEYAILFLSAVFGFVVLMTYTVLLELVVECTYPLIPEAISTGVVFIVGQIQGTLFFVIMEMFATEVKVGNLITLDMRSSLLAVAGIVVFFCVIFIVFFKTEYRRTKEECLSINSLLEEGGIVHSTTYGTLVT